MHYVISDIHGCYDEYREALEKINFQDCDLLYVLGDCIDRGYASVKVLKDMMYRPNVIPIVGNHEYMALDVLKDLCVEITAKNAETLLDAEMLLKYADWMKNGGDRTIQEFRALPMDEKLEILDYLGDFSLYEEVSLSGRNYLLVHGGLEPFREGMDVEDFSVAQLLFSKADYDRMYFSDRFTVTGHTPTISQPGNKGTVIKRNNHIAIDCGCVFGYNLAVYCMDTDHEIYIPYKHKEDCGPEP